LRWLLLTTLLVQVAPPIAAGLSDPTRPPEGGAEVVEPAPDTGSGRLQSILVSESRRLAVIDGQRVGVGDRIGTARVLRIERDSVLLEDAEGTWMLSFGGGLEKTPVEPQR
jgi:MSHA biogenesis protein MshK